MPERWHWGQPVSDLRAHLKAGGVLAIPSESSYGLAADPRHAGGVAAIFELKGRQGDMALPVVAADIEQVIALGVDPARPEFEPLSRLWPAPLTVVLPVDKPLAAAAGDATLALRVPAHRRLRQLMRDLGFAVTATSANRSGAPPILDPEELESFLQPFHKRRSVNRPSVVIVDDGQLPGGPPSTLVRWELGDTPTPGVLEPRILRQGAFPANQLHPIPAPLPPVGASVSRKPNEG